MWSMGRIFIFIYVSVVVFLSLASAAPRNECYAGACPDAKLCVPQPKECDDDRRTCPQFACIDPITVNMCSSHVCPNDTQCVDDSRCAGDNCPKYWCYDRKNRCYPRCETHELCVQSEYGRYLCVPQLNEKNAVFDGRPKSKFRACTKHENCYEHREPMEWGCCQITGIHDWTERGCYCDERIGSCVMEQREFSWMRWTFCVPKHEFKLDCQGVKCRYT